MKSSGPWNLRGLRPEAREAARQAARRSGMSVGEWLNSVIRPADEDDEWSADFGPETEEQSQPRRRRDDGEREQHPGADRRRREPDDYWAQSRRQESRRQESRRKESRRQESRRQESLRRESLRRESLRQESLARKAFARKTFARKTFVKTAVVKTTASPKSTAKPMMTAVIATETTSRRFRGKALPIAKTIAVPASRITKSHAGSARFNPVASGRIFINIVMKATWADRIMNRRCSNRPISKRPRNARRSTDATSLQPPGRRMTKSRAGNAPSQSRRERSDFINTMMKAMRAVRVVNRPCSSRMSSRFAFEPAHERPALKPRNERAFTAPREHVRDGFVDKAVAEIMARQRVLESAVPPRRQRTLDGGASAEPPPAQRAVDKAAARISSASARH